MQLKIWITTIYPAIVPALSANLVAISSEMFTIFVYPSIWAKTRKKVNMSTLDDCKNQSNLTGMPQQRPKPLFFLHSHVRHFFYVYLFKLFILVYYLFQGNQLTSSDVYSPPAPLLQAASFGTAPPDSTSTTRGPTQSQPCPQLQAASFGTGPPATESNSAWTSPTPTSTSASRIGKERKKERNNCFCQNLLTMSNYWLDEVNVFCSTTFYFRYLSSLLNSVP